LVVHFNQIKINDEQVVSKSYPAFWEHLKLAGFEMVEKGIPRHDYEIIDAKNNVIGVVTSGTQSPSLQKAIGMGYVSKEHATEGNDIYIKIRDKAVKAVIVKTPFLKK